MGKIKIVMNRPPDKLSSLFSGTEYCVWEGDNGLKFAAVWRQAGHNNIKHNPVFRGMPWMKISGFLTKGKL
jgi:hypothetical protein